SSRSLFHRPARHQAASSFPTRRSSDLHAPYDNKKYTDYELIIHGDAIEKEVRYKVTDIEAMKDIQIDKEYSLSNSDYFWYYNTRSEEHTSELQSVKISYAVFCLKKRTA